MKQPVLGLALVLGVALPGALPGCKKTPPPAGKANLKVSEARADPLKPALNMLRQATDVGQYRDALHLMNSYLSREPDKQVAPLSAEDKEALQKSCRLDNEEMAEVEAGLFRPLDAYHLQSCFLFRDASRLLEIANLAPLEQARLCFQWVMRRVQLHEQADAWLPSAFVLRRGFGGGRDRAIAFLTLLRQFQIEGCVVAPPGLPDEASSPIFAGVLLTQDEKPALFLFDPRLGQPVPGPNGKGIATFRDVRAHPELLKPSAIPAELVSKLDVYQISPLEALSPRMRFLQDLAAFQDKVILFQDAVGLGRELAKATGKEALVWNSLPPPKGPPPPSPTRALRLFISPEDGGIDKQGRLDGFMHQQLQTSGSVRQFKEMRVFKEIPELARAKLLGKTMELFTTFSVEPKELFLRGQFEASLHRVDRIRTVLETEEAAKPLEEAVFQKRIQEWRERLREAYTALLVRKEPGGQAKVNAFWSEDLYLLNLLHLESEIPLQKFERKLLTLILLNACREPLGQQGSYLVASCWNEKAAQLQAHQHLLESAGKDATIVQDNARRAWENTRGAWNTYLGRYQVSASGVHKRLEEIQQRWNLVNKESALNWEQLHLDMHNTFQARLCLAEAQQQLQPGPAPSLEVLWAELGAFQKSDLSKNLEECLKEARSVPPLAQRLELLTRDWSPQGNIHWLRETARRRLDNAK